MAGVAVVGGGAMVCSMVFRRCEKEGACSGCIMLLTASAGTPLCLLAHCFQLPLCRLLLQI